MKYIIIIHITDSTENEICCFEHKFKFYLLSYSFFCLKLWFFGDTYVNWLVLLVKKNDRFSEIPFSKVNSIF